MLLPLVFVAYKNEQFLKQLFAIRRLKNHVVIVAAVNLVKDIKIDEVLLRQLHTRNAAMTAVASHRIIIAIAIATIIKSKATSSS